jgi:peptidoglycan/xylan/chitin deacetylase (PgdA/CDA1 family)
MKPLRILLVSQSRPSRTWKLADRIRREVPEASICGIVQQPLSKLPMAQQLIANGHTTQVSRTSRALSNVRRYLRSFAQAVMHRALWFIHGCPPGLNAVKTFTIAELTDACGQAEWPLLVVENLADRSVLNLVQQVELVVALDPIVPAPFVLSGRGLIRVSRHTLDATRRSQGIQITIDHFSKESPTPRPIVSLAVPLQDHDGLLGFTLKTDLIADDLLVETTKTLSLVTEQRASEEVTEWMERMFSPYLAQLHQPSLGNTQPPGARQRHRRTWKLCLDTLLLCSPAALVRNWWRQWRGQCPVLILTHHLVADRPHRMGVSTEEFWRQVRFLQRHYSIVSLAKAVELLRAGQITVPTVALTFDDGYADNFISLRAVAEEAGIPVSLFMVAQPVELRREFQHDLDRGITGFFPLTWDQVRFWHARGAEFGSHTRTHIDCGAADSDILKREIIGSKNDLEERLRSPVRFFAFPFGGRQNMSVEAIEIAASAYSHFVSGFGGENRPTIAGTALHLRRKNLYGSLWELELELHSVFDRVNRWRQRLLPVRRQLNRISGARAAPDAPAIASR